MLADASHLMAWGSVAGRNPRCLAASTQKCTPRPLVLSQPGLRLGSPAAARWLSSPVSLAPPACRFAYVTSGFSLLFSLLLAAGGYVTLKQGVSGFLPPIYGSLGLFGSFWWMVAAITFTQRGKQASDDGLPEESARNGVIALSWLEFILFLAAGVAVIYDRCVEGLASGRVVAVSARRRCSSWQEAGSILRQGAH